jgi:hypothetical protein
VIDGPGPVRAAELPDGTALSPEAARRLGCDATLIAALLGPHGQVLDIGRATRTIPRALRRAPHRPRPPTPARMRFAVPTSGCAGAR